MSPPVFRAVANGSANSGLSGIFIDCLQTKAGQCDCPAWTRAKETLLYSCKQIYLVSTFPTHTQLFLVFLCKQTVECMFHTYTMEQITESAALAVKTA